jgi:hypothetical protein
MIDNIYIIESIAKTRPAEIAHAVADMRRGSAIGVEPSRTRRAIASAIVRFGIFLNGSSYHCPEAACER